ncbi:MAG TPA: S8 family serine peptidase [Longimicrobiales bacterium]|nr:S8 family serine peptidase [Longimicrobiales bacterium]
MRRITTLALAALALAACADLEPTGPSAVAPLDVHLGADAVPGSYIVVMKADADPVKVVQLAGTRAKHLYQASIRGFAADLTDRQLDEVRRHPDVAYVEMDRFMTFAPPCGTPAGGPCEGDGGGGGEVKPWGVTRVNGGVSGATGTAWVIDTGIDLDHPDLKVDVARSANFVTKGKDSPDDGHGHGTHVAGTIAAIDNEIDVIGVAAGATLVAVRVLDNSGSGSYSGVIAGVDYVGANGSSGDVANMSLGGPPSQALDDAVLKASQNGVRFALAAGNDGADANNYSPARVNGTNIYTISAIASSDCLTSWSNWGNPPVDYAEPGASILSTKKGGGTTTMSGTSMAAPHAAGLLLIGSIKSGGAACNDPDGNADTIGVH